MRISDFLAYFYPDPEEEIFGRVIAAKKTDVFPKAVSIPFTRTRLSNDMKLQQELRRWNKTHGIYFVVNAGGDEDESITRINAVYCEMDDKTLEEQLDVYELSPLAPSLQVMTKKSVHAYWLLEETITANEFITLQKGLIKYFNADPKICNPSRVMRIPFFNHVSKEGADYVYKRVEIHSATGFRYSFAELFNEFPYQVPKPKPYRPLHTERRNEANDLLVERIIGSSTYRQKGQYGYTRGKCHNGKGNSGVFVHLPTGAVKCFFGCSWHEIAAAFGIHVERKY